jgi:uncharacterized sulfatase
VVEFVDIFPTVVDLANLLLPPGLSGRSLKPLLQDPGRPWDHPAFTQILRPADQRLPAPVMGRSVRTERWRYTEWNGGSEGVELYDHEADPGEFKNLARSPTGESERVMAELKTKFEDKARAEPPSTPFDPKRL